jgi:hypothetical protein
MDNPSKKRKTLSALGATGWVPKTALAKFLLTLQDHGYLDDELLGSSGLEFE